MSKQQQETLSALFDGEASEFETRRLLQEIGRDGLRQWRSHQLIRDSINKTLDQCVLSINIVDAVAAEIANDPTPDLKQTSPHHTASKQQSWLKPAIGFAAAASVAFVVVINVQQNDTATGTNNFVANGNVSASQLQINSDIGMKAGLSAVSGSSNAAVNIDRNQATQGTTSANPEQQQEFLYYLQKHAQHAAFNNSQGLLPVARTSKEE